MAKSVAFFLLTLLAITMLQTMVMASNGHGGHHYDQVLIDQSLIIDVMDLGVSRAINVEESATGDVGIHSTTKPALHSVTNAAKSVCVCLQGIMGINKFVLATTTGRPRKEDPSAHRNPPNFLIS
ncbi:hypothetical protein EZV62_015380 [Acer yangbiense]|uniref:Uncharacterized protein n=1 Tax=Acer yangbiense TaxID=1000413 RepID=A0A5C7HKR3_9ROSI|nr:hypothetical protein EZV62_015380 [Acer yangbiense]